MNSRTRSRMRRRVWTLGIARIERTWRPLEPTTCCCPMVGLRSSIISPIRMGIGRWCDTREPPLIPRDLRDLGTRRATDIRALILSLSRLSTNLQRIKYCLMIKDPNLNQFLELSTNKLYLVIFNCHVCRNYFKTKRAI